METQKTNLTKEQKREQRLQRRISPQGITFRDSKTEKLYQERVRRFIKAFLCDEPDRVPVMVPASLLTFGDVKDVKACCRKLIEDCAPGGGYVLTGGTAVTEAKPENLRAFMQVAKEYGAYH